jgi:hypothetical protein
VEDHSQEWRLRHPKDAPLGALLTVIFARRENARLRGGRPGRFLQARSPWARCAGNRLPAGSGGSRPEAAPRPVGSRP